MAAQISVKIKPLETTQTASKTLGPEELRPEQRKADRQVEQFLRGGEKEIPTV